MRPIFAGRDPHAPPFRSIVNPTTHNNIWSSNMRLMRCLAFVVLLSIPVLAQDRPADQQTAFARAQHLRHGINASEWFAQSASDYSAARTDRYTDAAGHCAHGEAGLRQCAAEHRSRAARAVSAATQEGFNADFLGRLDRAVDAMLANGLAVADRHPSRRATTSSRCKNSNEGVERFAMLWRRLAAHYATAIRRRSSSRS